MKAESDTKAEKAKSIAGLFRFICPSYYIPGKQDQPVDIPLIRREIARVQRIIQGENFEIRKTLWTYSLIIEKQRQIILVW